MPNELLFLRQLAGGDGWLSAAMLVGLFLIVVLRREMIVLTGLFRLGVVFFALSIAIPPFVMPIASYISGTNFGRRSGIDGNLAISLFMSASGPVLMALTILCVFNSIMPRVFNRKVETPVPTKHPLDD